MELRDFLKDQWPPKWVSTSEFNIAGEQGTLIQVDQPSSETLELKVERYGDEYTGQIQVSDPSRQSELFTLLRRNIGKSISAIGDLTLPG